MKDKKTIALLIVLIVGSGSYMLINLQPQDNSTTGEAQQEVMKTDNETTIKAEMEFIDVGPRKAKELIDQNPELVIIDVSPNYAEGHLPGAVNYYLGDGSLEEEIPMLDKEKTYLVYCHVESVSIQGAQLLVDAGFENVYRLDGDYSAWVEAGYEIDQ
jgi:rhodanese-related sulfurtransferase